jgi:hypothetical protein
MDRLVMFMLKESWLTSKVAINYYILLVKNYSKNKI